MQAKDRQTRTSETTGGRYGNPGIQYEYKRGPDGKKYAVKGNAKLPALVSQQAPTVRKQLLGAEQSTTKESTPNVSETLESTKQNPIKTNPSPSFNASVAPPPSSSEEKPSVRGSGLVKRQSASLTKRS